MVRCDAVPCERECVVSGIKRMANGLLSGPGFSLRSSGVAVNDWLWPDRVERFEMLTAKAPTQRNESRPRQTDGQGMVLAGSFSFFALRLWSVRLSLVDLVS